MRAIPVIAPDSTEWTVRVAWEPRWRALARRFGGWRQRRRDSKGGGGGANWDNLGNLGQVDDLSALLVIIAIFIGFIVTIALFWWVLLPLLLVVLDAVIVVILLVVAVIGRVLFRRPWTVEALASTGEKISVEVVGWRAALRKRDEMADELGRGLKPRVDLGTTPAL